MIYILDDYAFLEELVKEGQMDNDPFYKNGLALADKPVNPNCVYVFSFHGGYIFAVYGWTKHKDKAFLKFHKKIENLMFKFGMPILRMGKNPDFKNHTIPAGEFEGKKVFQFVRGSHG